MCNGDFHFDSTPIAPPGTTMLMHVKPENRSSFGFNAKKTFYIGPAFKHYRTFKGLIPATGGERLSDLVKFKHHAIAIPDLTPADRILEAARQLDSAIKQQPKKAPMDEITAVEILRKVVTGSQRDSIPLNSVQIQNKRTKPQSRPSQSQPCHRRTRDRQPQTRSQTTCQTARMKRIVRTAMTP